MPTSGWWDFDVKATIVSLEGAMFGQEFVELRPGTNDQLALAARYLSQVIPRGLEACDSSDGSRLFLLHARKRGLKLLPFKVV
jgi:hypothetical protein